MIQQILIEFLWNMHLKVTYSQLHSIPLFYSKLPSFTENVVTLNTTNLILIANNRILRNHLYQLFQLQHRLHWILNSYLTHIFEDFCLGIQTHKRKVYLIQLFDNRYCLTLDLNKGTLNDQSANISQSLHRSIFYFYFTTKLHRARTFIIRKSPG